MFDWVTLIILIGCTLVCLVPTAIAFWLIPYLKEQVSLEYFPLIFVGMYGVSKKIVDNNIQKVRRIEWI